MTAEEFNTWLVTMVESGPRSRGKLSDAAAASLLGCSRTTVVAYREGLKEAPRYVGLACSALSKGMGPWPHVEAPIE